MSPARLLSALAAGGWRLRAEGARLVVSGPPLPTALRAAVAEHKTALLAHLAAASWPTGRVATPDGPGRVVQHYPCAVRGVEPHLRVQLDGEAQTRPYAPEALTPLASQAIEDRPNA